MTDLWNHEDIVAGLERLLEARTGNRYHGIIDQITENNGRGSVATERYYWGIFIGIGSKNRRRFRRKAPYSLRTGPETWTDRYAIRLAATTNSREVRGNPPTPEYLSEVLRRPLSFVTEIWKKEGISKGRKGFMP